MKRKILIVEVEGNTIKVKGDNLEGYEIIGICERLKHSTQIELDKRILGMEKMPKKDKYTGEELIIDIFNVRVCNAIASYFWHELGVRHQEGLAAAYRVITLNHVFLRIDKTKFLMQRGVGNGTWYLIELAFKKAGFKIE